MTNNKHAIIRDESWSYECGEPQCCSDYGTNLYVNDVLITERFDGDVGDIIKVLNLFGITSEHEDY